MQRGCSDSNQVSHSDKYHQILCGWSKHTHNKSKMADGRHFAKKIEKILISQQYFHQLP